MHRGKSARSMHIGVVHLIAVTRRDSSMLKVPVVNVRDIDIRDSRIRYIDAIKISATYPVPRDERFPKTQRTPSEASAETKSRSKSESAAKPGNQRRSVVRTDINRARRPSPEAAGIDPPAIVKWSESPGLIVNPGPTPRVFPNPVAGGVWRPTNVNPRRPHRSIVWGVAPCSIFIEIIGTNDVGRDVTP